ncbi:MAG TPA: hypothetical protein VJC37_05045 [Planctomycetota bacterium]|nr:hypothetical protein [Planctomycetota bacterium]
MKRARLWVLWLVIFGLIFLSSCTTQYQTARKFFYRANQSYIKQQSEDALIRYCQSLGQLESGADKNPASRLLKAAIYHRLYLADARTIYQNSSIKTKEKYASFSELLSTTDNADFLNSAFNEILAIEKDLKSTDLKTIDPFLLVQRDIIVADKLSNALDMANKIITTTGQSLPIEFIKSINSYGYEEIIKSLYLNAWASSLIQYQKSSPDKESIHSTNEIMYKLSLSRLKYIYYSLRNNTALLKTPSFQNVNNHYHETISKIEKIILSSDLSPFTVSSPEQAASDLLGETIDRNYLNLDPGTHLTEARNQMNLSIEMIVTDKSEKAESHLLSALKSIICAKELSVNQSEANIRLIATALNDIYLNLYRISIADTFR